MKKLFLAVMAAVAVIGVTTEASAQNNFAARKVWETVVVRTNAAANPSPGFIDSSAWSAVGAEAATSAVLDTTIAFDTDNWIVHPGSPGTTDSTDFITLLINDSVGNSSDAGSDSIGVSVQVSADAQAWTTALAFKGGTFGTVFALAGNNQTIVDGIRRDQLSANGAGNSPKVWVYKFRHHAANGMAGPDMQGLSAFRYVRFIFWYIEPSGYKLSARLGHYEVGI